MVDNSTSHTIYPHASTLTRLNEPGLKPTHKQILLVQLDANSSSADAVFGNHGHVILTLSPAECTQPSMDPPPPPGANANPTAAQLAEALRLHTNAWTAYKLMQASKRDLRNQLLAAAADVYWRRLRHVRLGYNTCSIQDMLNHLIESCGPFTEQTERKEVASRMDVPWKADHSNLSFNKLAMPPTRSPLLAPLCQRNTRRTSYMTL